MVHRLAEIIPMTVWADEGPADEDPVGARGQATEAADLRSW